MSFYPPEISEKFYQPKNAGSIEKADAEGTGASFVCGAAIRFFLKIQDGRVLEAKYRTNGCGFMIARAEILAENIAGKNLTELHALENSPREFKEFARKHCAEAAFDALQKALANFRLAQIEEFTGEKALICTCFGVTEETLEKIIAENQAETVEEVGDICNAGTGCGSCKFLIQDLIDIYEFNAETFLD